MTTRSAVYSYGMLLWELLTFKPLFADEDPMLVCRGEREGGVRM